MSSITLARPKGKALARPAAPRTGVFFTQLTPIRSREQFEQWYELDPFRRRRRLYDAIRLVYGPLRACLTCGEIGCHGGECVAEMPNDPADVRFMAPPPETLPIVDVLPAGWPLSPGRWLDGSPTEEEGLLDG